MTHILVPKHLAEAIRDYLSTKPAGEVFQLLIALRAAKEVKVEEDA